MTYDRFNEIAALAAERGYSVTAGTLNKGALESLAEELGITLEGDYSFDTLLESIEKLGGEFDELAASALAV